MTVINTNIPANRVMASMGQTTRAMALSMQRLSTGRSINIAADNAAGMAISDRMTAQIRGLDMAVRNIQDGISLADTAGGALNALSNMAQRMRELSIQSLNGTLSDSDREALDQEFQDLKQQMAATIAQTEWNGIPLLSPRSSASSLVTPALIAGTGPINTQAPASGSYDLFINGHAVSVDLQQGEPAATRLAKIVTAIGQTTSVHGASARTNALGGIDLYTADGSDLSAWYDASISGLSAANFGLGTPAVAQKTNITIAEQSTHYPTTVQGQDHIDLSGYGGSGETIALVQSPNPVTTAGVFSAVGQVVYKGDGAKAVAVGTVDSVNNGQGGLPLRINFSNTFENGGFETTGSNGSIPGWTTLNQRITLNGVSTIAGWPTPTDASKPNVSPGETASISGASYQTQISSEHTEGAAGLKLESTGLTIDSYGIAHGPAIVSNQAAAINAGDSVSFDWKAVNGQDDYDVYAYLLNVDTGATVELLNDTGGVTAWSSKTVTVPASGNYKFVFISGTFDATGGRAAGACLYIDNIQVNTPPYTPSAGDLAQIQALATYSDVTPFTVTTTINGTSFTSVASTSKTQAFDSLQTLIAAAIASGALQNIQLTRQGDTLEILSTQAGTPFTVTQTSATSPYRSLSATPIVANRSQQDVIDAIPGATAASTGATVVHGRQATDADLQASKNIQIQAGANERQYIQLELPDYGSPGGSLDALVGDSQGQSSVDIATASQAQLALQTLDDSLATISLDQSRLGASVNRLIHAGENVAHMGIHQSASRSTIMDTDYAQEASRLVKWQILEQASAAMLAQANVLNKQVLDLLKP